MARPIWKGQLVFGKHEIPIKIYSAVADRKVHFRLLHAKDLTPLHQKVVRKTDGKEVPKDKQLKAFPLDRDTAVILRPDELEELEPPTSRDIDLCRFVPTSAISDQWYDKPYYLGPDGDEADYFALSDAIADKKVAGVARWVMRKKRYVAALTALDGYLMLITLRRAEQVLAMPELKTPAASKPDEKELKLAKQLVSAISDDFDPKLWQDEYHKRVCELIEAKAAGKEIDLKPAKPKRATADLSEALRRSLSSVKEKKVA